MRKTTVALIVVSVGFAVAVAALVSGIVLSHHRAGECPPGFASDGIACKRTVNAFPLGPGLTIPNASDANGVIMTGSEQAAVYRCRAARDCIGVFSMRGTGSTRPNPIMSRPLATGGHVMQDTWYGLRHGVNVTAQVPDGSITAEIIAL